MNQAGIAHRHVLRISIVLNAYPGQYCWASSKDADVELNDPGVLHTEEVTG